jgi:biopolymer transport protein ExbB/TolQ
MTERIDTEEVQRLLDAIEQDLAKMKGDAPQLQKLRAELERLRTLLARPEEHHGLGERLHELRAALENAFEHALDEGLTVSSYVTRIGRMLGL